MFASWFEREVGSVPPEWIDYNGHMNVLHYLEASERASDAFYEELGIGAAYRALHQCGMFAAEHHTVYKAELRLGDPLRVRSTLHDCSASGIHFLNHIYRGDGVLAASIEHVELHVDLATRRVAPFRAGVAERLLAIRAAHAAGPLPAPISRVMGLRHRDRPA